MLALLGPKVSFSFIPEPFADLVRCDVMEHYYAAAQRFDVICLDENIVQMNSFQYLRILYYYEFGTIIDESIVEDPEEWRYLHGRYPIDQHGEQFEQYRKELKSILMEAQLVFEENWVFSNAELKDALVGMYNEPLQSVW